ncbi:unnamed protein product [Mytilus coruscus]|uniref:Uncharacterized protein n=1 Tax=Mytilus coruscus TaxID=42192 RepID=A0A6J7ZXH4_MYTCO|nr:unnamed protein product [Mytilus coruscus]
MWSFFQDNKDYFYSLSSNTADLIKKFVDVLKQASEALSRGNILIQDLKTILGKAGNYKSIVMEIKDDLFKPGYIMATLSLREKEWLTYQSTLKTVQDFMSMCSRIEGNTRDLEERITQIEELDNVNLNMLCKVAFLEDMKNQEQYHPVITAFGLDESLLQILPHVMKYCKGNLFTILWDRKGNELSKQKGMSLDIDEIILGVWEPTYKLWNDLCSRLKSGDLKFSEFERYFQTADMETLRDDLMKLCDDGNNKWINSRLDQLENTEICRVVWCIIWIESKSTKALQMLYENSKRIFILQMIYTIQQIG